MVDQYHPDVIPLEHLKEIGFDRVRHSKDIYDNKETSGDIKKLKENGFRVYCEEVPDSQTLEWLSVCGADLMCGQIVGILSDEDDIIRDALNKLQ